MKFGRKCSASKYSWIHRVGFLIMSYFQNGGHDVRPPLIAACAAAPLAAR